MHLEIIIDANASQQNKIFLSTMHTLPRASYKKIIKAINKIINDHFERKRLRWNGQEILGARSLLAST
jgi:hypothetical protein